MVSAISQSVSDPECATGAPAGARVQADQKKRELRVLQVFSVLGVGGAETWLISLLKYFHENNRDLHVKLSVDIRLTGGAKAVFDDEAIALGTRLFYVAFTRRNTLGFIREFRRILAGGHYDAIHDHQDYIAGLNFLMELGHLPAVRIAHCSQPALPPRQLRRWANPALCAIRRQATVKQTRDACDGNFETDRTLVARHHALKV